MKQLELYLKRFKNPTVILSVVSQIILLLGYFHINIDTQVLNGVITAVLSILVTLGIVSNPDTKNKTYGDDLMFCEECNTVTKHVQIGNDMVCSVCQTVNK